MKLGIIGGTALEQLVVGRSDSIFVETAWGRPSAPISRNRIGATEVLFLNRHGLEHRIPPHQINYRANLSALHQQHVDGIVAVYSAGGITQRMTAGSLVVPDQIVDYTWGREHTYSDGPHQVLQHIDFTHPYDDELRQKLLRAGADCGAGLIDGGVYGVAQGPRLETAAEVRRLERDGCDLIGMTGMPEAALARELGVPFAGLVMVVNPAAGKSDRLISMAEIAAVMAEATPGLLSVLSTFCQGSGP